MLTRPFQEIPAGLSFVIEGVRIARYEHARFIEPTVSPDFPNAWCETSDQDLELVTAVRIEEHSGPAGPEGDKREDSKLADADAGEIEVRESFNPGRGVLADDVGEDL